MDQAHIRAVGLFLVALFLVFGCSANVSDDADEVDVTSAALKGEKDRTVTETQDPGADPSKAAQPTIENNEGDFGSSTASSGVQVQEGE